MAHVASHGKGRKERITPLDAAMALALQAWYEENLSPAPASAVFTAQGSSRPMTTDAVAQRLRVHTRAAATPCPTLAAKTVTPHVLRHTNAMRMLAAGIDTASISLWLGHESIESTQAYLHADLGIKQRALDRTAPPDPASPSRCSWTYRFSAVTEIPSSGATEAGERPEEMTRFTASALNSSE